MPKAKAAEAVSTEPAPTPIAPSPTVLWCDEWMELQSFRSNLTESRTAFVRAEFRTAPHVRRTDAEWRRRWKQWQSATPA